MFQFLPQAYWSPRWSWEYIDCSMPMTFDTYSNCWFNCLYCFASLQRWVWNGKEQYFNKQVKKINFAKFEKMMREPDKYWGEFAYYIKNRYVLQRGGMSDPMCPIEEEWGVWLKCLQLFNDLEYPVRFSSKSDLILRDDRYLKEFEKWKDHFAYMASIITYNPEIADKLENWTPTPQRRMEVLKVLSDMGLRTVLRLRPYIVWITDKTVKEMLNDAGKAWVKAISTEFLCLDQRAPAPVKAKFQRISKLCWFDIYAFYKKYANTKGYLRLSREFTRPYMDELIHLCAKNNIKLAVSCPKHKEKTFWRSCCWLPTEWPLSNTHKWQYMRAIKVAQEKWEVHRNDMAKYSIFANTKRLWATGLNTGNWRTKALNQDQTMLDFLHNLWNNPKKQNSPYKLYEWVLLPVWVDENWDVVYQYNPKA